MTACAKDLNNNGQSTYDPAPVIMATYTGRFSELVGDKIYSLLYCEVDQWTWIFKLRSIAALGTEVLKY